MSQPTTAHTRWPVAIALGLLGSLAVGLVVLGFLWPAKTSTAHNLPVSISGPATSINAMEQAVSQKSPDLFDFVQATDRDEAVRQIEQRETYGAIILPQDPTTSPEVLTAPAGSAAATQMLNGVAAQLQGQLTQAAAAAGIESKTTVSITPVVPLSASDPSGTGLVAASFPITMGGMIGGVLIALLVVGPVRRLAALGGFAIGVGLILSLVMHSWFEYLQGGFWINALVMGASVLATAAFIVGCASLLGTKGIGVGAVITMFVGNPLASAATPWQFMPEPWGAIGQFFVPGASGTLTRTISYFPHADPSAQWWILTAWITLGVVLTIAGHFRSQIAIKAAGATLEEDRTNAA